MMQKQEILDQLNELLESVNTEEFIQLRQALLVKLNSKQSKSYQKYRMLILLESIDLRLENIEFNLCGYNKTKEKEEEK